MGLISSFAYMAVYIRIPYTRAKQVHVSCLFSLLSLTVVQSWLVSVFIVQEQSRYANRRSPEAIRRQWSSTTGYE